MEFKDKVMDVSKKVGDVAEKTYKAVTEKSTKMFEEAKLKIKGSDIETEIEKMYSEFGERVYEKYKTGEDVGEFTKDCKKIDKMFKEIKDIETKILYFKDLRKCETCGENIGLDNKFCPVCGAKQKKVKKPEKEEVVEEVVTKKECPDCGTVHGIEVNFCTKCGYKF